MREIIRPKEYRKWQRKYRHYESSIGAVMLGTIIIIPACGILCQIHKFFIAVILAIIFIVLLLNFFITFVIYSDTFPCDDFEDYEIAKSFADSKKRTKKNLKWII